MLSLPSLVSFFVSFFLSFPPIFGLIAGPSFTCGGNSTAATGTLSYGDYGANVECDFTLVGSNITIVFTCMDVEGNINNVCYDNVRLYNATGANGKYLQEYCGTTLPSPYTATGTSVRIQFTTDNIVQRTGWALTWTLTPGK